MSHQTTTETADSFKDLINELMKLDDIVIEIIGCFIWVTGNTKPNKDKLKSLGFQWHSKKYALCTAQAEQSTAEEQTSLKTKQHDIKIKRLRF